MNEIKTDLDFAYQFTKAIHEDYQTAIEFLNDNPDYALLKFRKITEELCVLIGKKMEIEFSSSSLFDRIEDLDIAQVINQSTKRIFHQLRKLCNDGIHGGRNITMDDQQSYILETKKKFLEKANQARNYTIELLEDIYLSLNLGNELPKFSIVNSADYDLKKVIYEGATSSTHQSKLKAGIAYETIAKQESIDKPLVVENSFKLYHDGLLKLAASHYESAVELSFEESTYRHSPENLFLYCDVESLFRSAKIAASGLIRGVTEKDALTQIKIAADRDYPEAVAYYGGYLFDEGRYEESKKYLQKAVDVDSALGNRYMFYLYSKAEHTEKLALKHLEKAIELGCIDSIGELGALYHKGFIVEQNIEKAEDLLLESISKGSFIGKRYHLVEFNDLVGWMQENARKFSQEMEKAFSNIQKELEESKPKPITVNKIGRNDPCICGSNKKYKKCCGNVTSNPKKGLLPPLC